MRSQFPSDWLFAHADRRPEAQAIATPTSRLGYGKLAEQVRRASVPPAAAIR